MIIEGMEFVLRILKCAVYPYPKLISAGWSHMAAVIFMTVLYAAYIIIFVVLWQMEQEKEMKE